MDITNDIIELEFLKLFIISFWRVAYNSTLLYFCIIHDDRLFSPCTFVRLMKVVKRDSYVIGDAGK